VIDTIRKSLLSFLFFLFLAFYAQGQIWIEDFDGSNAGSPVNFNLPPCGGDPDVHYFGVVCLFGGGCSLEISPAWSTAYNNVMGNFLGAYDTDNANGCGGPGMGNDLRTAEWFGIDISSCAEPNNLFLCFDVAHFGNNQSSLGWDPPSEVLLNITIDGGMPITLAAIEDQGDDTNPAFDLDCDGVGDGSHLISNTFTSYCFQIPGYGSTADILININGLNQPFEDVGIDNVAIYCEADPANLPGAVLLSCGDCGADNDCDGVISSEDCNDDDASASTTSETTFDDIPSQCAGDEDPLPLLSLEGFSGSWSPVFDPLTTTTYTFSPDAGQCASDAMVTVTIEAQTSSTFDPISNQCAGDPDPLPNMSLEGFTGTWSPAYDPSTTTTYTFAPDIGQCASDAMVMVTIDELMTSTFDPIPSQCEGESDPLSDQSLEGFTGTWSPSFDPNTTTTYTFSPDVGQCASDAMVTVSIDALTSSTFDMIPSQCEGESDPLQTQSLEGFTGTWSPAFDPTASITYTFMPDAGQCADEAMLTVTIEPLTPATFNIIPSQCEGESNPLPVQSLEGFTGSWSPSFDPLSTNTYTFTPDADQCAGEGILTVTIEPLTVSTFDAIPSQCEGESNPLPPQSLEGFTGIWMPTFDPTTTTTYIFTPDPDQCAIAGMATVIIEAPTPSTFSGIPSQCQGETDPLPAQSLEGFTGTWTPTFDPNTTTTYTFVADANQCTTDASVTVVIDQQISTTFDDIPNQCAGEPDPLPLLSLEGTSGTWTPFFDPFVTLTYTFTPDAGSCAMDGQLTVVIDQPVLPDFVTFGPYCVDDVPDDLPTTSLNGISGSWDNTISTSNPGVTTYTFSPNPEFCASETTMNIVVEDCGCSLPATVTIDDISAICEDETLSLVANLGGSATSATWSSSGDGSFGDINSLSTTYSPGVSDIANASVTLVVTTDDPDGTGPCSPSSAEVILTINLLVTPEFTQLGPYCQNDLADELPTTSLNGINGSWNSSINTMMIGVTEVTFTPTGGQCSNATTMSIEIVELQGSTFDMIPGQCEEGEDPLPDTSVEGFTGSWTPAFDPNTTTTYTFTPDADQCASANTLTVVIDERVSPVFDQLGPYCVNDTPDPLENISTNGINGTWNGPIDSSSPGTSTYTFTPSDDECAITATMQIDVNDCACGDPALINIDDIAPICEDESSELVANLGGSASQVTWSTGGDGSFDDVMAPSPTYTPGAADLANGLITLTATTDDPDGNGPCLEASASATLIIDQEETPQFDQLGPYCIDESPELLPTTSINGIIGTWDGPIATASAGTSTYTFTPNDEECAISTTMQIEVNDCGCGDPALIIIDNIEPICEDEITALVANLGGSASQVTWSTDGDGSFDNIMSASPTYTPGAADLANGSITLTATTDDPDGIGPCLEASASATLSINQEETPQFDQLGPYCIDESPDLLPTTSANGITGIWDGPIVTASAGSSTYTFTPSDDDCASEAIMQIEINDCGCGDPALITIDDIDPICEDESLAITANLAGSATQVTWSTDGDGSFDDITSSSPRYIAGASDVTNGSVTLTATTDDPDGSGPCLEASASATLSINQQETPQFDQLGPYCIDESPDLLPTTSVNGIVGTWDGPIVTASVGSGIYTFTPENGSCAENITMTILIEDCGCGGATSTQPCDDDNPCTIDDVETILDSDGSICIPCIGIEQDCSNGSVIVIPCDDGNSTTTNDEETILECDGTVCIPCEGTIEEIKLITIITPNGDGDNDALIFEGLENFPENTLRIYNRWGNLVYGKNGYQQGDELWRGDKYGEELPSDTYYYILTYNNQVFKESITILR